jgi:hypothetical protein
MPALALGAAVLVFPWLVLAWNAGASALAPSRAIPVDTPWLTRGWNATVGRLFPGHAVPIVQQLYGVTAPTNPKLSLRTLMDGTFQHDASLKIGSLTPIYLDSVRLKNQLLYSAFNTPSIWSIAIGRDRELYEWPYIREYCTRDLTKFVPQAESWAQKLREIQDFYARRGRTFLYVITPSKAAQYPQYFPAGFKCLAREDDRVRLMDAYRTILDRHGIHYVDASRIVQAAQSSYPLPLFAKRGTHWNMIAAALATQAITTELNRLDSHAGLLPFTFTWQPSWQPTGTDRDLLNLLNLQVPDDHYEVPVLHFSSIRPASGCHVKPITAVAGSFMFQINQALVASACPPHIDYWYYFQIDHWWHDNGPWQAEPYRTSLEAERNRQLLEGDSIVILEENEEIAARSNHGPAFYDLIRAHETPLTAKD